MKLPTPPDLLPSITFYGDSSSRDKEFMVAGGFVVAGNRISEIEDRIASLRDDCGIRSEFHWADYRGGNRAKGYKALVDYAFELVNKKNAALHILISPFAAYKPNLKKGDNSDTSVNRMYYQLLLHRLGQFYGLKRAIHVRLDAGNDCSDICKMRGQVCADAYKRYSTRPNCFRTIEPVDSKNVGSVQMADVIVGAVAAKMNGAVYTSPKGELSDYVLKASGRHSWATDTHSSARFLTVWNFKPKQVPHSPSPRDKP
jgi:hypothetical protein